MQANIENCKEKYKQLRKNFAFKRICQHIANSSDYDYRSGNEEVKKNQIKKRIVGAIIELYKKIYCERK